MNSFTDWLNRGTPLKEEEEAFVNTVRGGDRFTQFYCAEATAGVPLWEDDTTYVVIEPDPPLVVVEYTFNRPLTWSEREEFRFFFDMEWYVEHIFRKKDPRVVTITVLDIDSRELTSWVSIFAEGLLNVHPVSAHTIHPKTRV